MGGGGGGDRGGDRGGGGEGEEEGQKKEEGEEEVKEEEVEEEGGRGGEGGGGKEGKKEEEGQGRKGRRKKRRRSSSSTGGAVRKLCKHKVGQHNLARVYSAILNIHTCALSKSFYGTFMQASVRDCSEQQSSTEPTTITGMYFGMSLIEHNGIIIMFL